MENVEEKRAASVAARGTRRMTNNRPWGKREDRQYLRKGRIKDNRTGRKKQGRVKAQKRWT
jgi:hypothetical protein